MDFVEDFDNAKNTVFPFCEVDSREARTFIGHTLSKEYDGPNEYRGVQVENHGVIISAENGSY